MTDKLTRKRKVILTIEVQTTLTSDELKDCRALVFGALRADTAEKGKRRMTIKKGKPARARPDIVGTIEQVQVNVVR